MVSILDTFIEANQSVLPTKWNASKNLIIYLFHTLQYTADLVTFTEEIFNGQLHFLCSDMLQFHMLLRVVSSDVIKKGVAGWFFCIYFESKILL